MISDSSKLLMFGANTANYDRPIFYSQSLTPSVSNHIYGICTNSSSNFGIQIVGSAGLFRIYKTPTDALLINNIHTSYDLYTSALYSGAVFGAGFYGFAAGNGGTLIKDSSNSIPNGYIATTQRLAISGLTGTIARSFTINSANGVFFGGNGQIVTGGGLGSKSGTTTWTSRSSGTTQPLMFGAMGRMRGGSGENAAYSNRMMIVGGNGTYTWSEDAATWFPSRFRNSTATMLGVAIADNMVVAVGTGGTIFTCNTENLGSDSLSNPNVWTQCFSPVASTLRAVCSPYIAPLNAEFSSARRRFWLAVGDGGVILSSPDGFTWSQCVSPTTAQLNCVMASAHFGAYVVGGQSGTILVGNDGT